MLLKKEAIPLSLLCVAAAMHFPASRLLLSELGLYHHPGQSVPPDPGSQRQIEMMSLVKCCFNKKFAFNASIRSSPLFVKTSDPISSSDFLQSKVKESK